MYRRPVAPPTGMCFDPAIRCNANTHHNYPLAATGWLTPVAGLAASRCRRCWQKAAADQPSVETNAREPKVRRIIQLFMTGGASPMDTFDYKPELERLHGQMLGPKEKPEGFTAPAGAIMKSPFAFAQHGESGRWVSSVFPEQAKLVDEMAFLMAMTTKTNVHGPART